MKSRQSTVVRRQQQKKHRAAEKRVRQKNTRLFREGKGKQTMAKLERMVQGSFDTVVEQLTRGILDGSISASLEDQVNYVFADGRVAVRVFERFSYLGGNRLTMTLIVAEHGGQTRVTAITSGGSQALFYKLNTFGEEAFLKKLEALL